MKFKVSKTSDWQWKDEVSLGSLKALLEFVEASGGEVIIHKASSGDKEWELEIYDDYRE